MRWLLGGFTRVHRLNRWFHLRFTGAGRAVVYLLVAAGVLGVDTQRSDAYQVVALCLALLLLAGAGSRWRRSPRLALSRHLPPFATVGEPFAYRRVIRNVGAHPVRGTVIRDLLVEPVPSAAEFARAGRDDDSASNWVDRRIGYPRWLALVHRLRGADIDAVTIPVLAPGAAHEAQVQCRPLRRGILTFDSTLILSADPLGLLHRVERHPAPGEVVVLPRRFPMPPLALPGTNRLQPGGVSFSLALGDSQEFVQLRDYRPGDALRHIHWRSFARIGTPVVKEYQDEYFTRHALVLDTFCDQATDTAFEAAVAVAASLVGAVRAREALLDLMFVEDRAYRFTAGRNVGQHVELLRVLAAVGRAPHADFALLADHVLTHARTLSGCVVILLALDAPRRAFLDRLRAFTRPIVLLVRTPEAEDNQGAPAGDAAGVWPIDPADIGGCLQRVRPEAP